MKNSRGTFIVKVDNYQNGTWQGRVIWADENVTEHFRSALELVKLIDEAVDARAISRKQISS
ncbi:hypothetical protein [Butyrivibrio sp. CB08]|uniref:hypothetical protein n=1 Tax=Butyrivibrio sp. CB08 TaxID=2364879 RepID=UPI002ED1F026